MLAARALPSLRMTLAAAAAASALPCAAAPTARVPLSNDTRLGMDVIYFLHYKKRCSCRIARSTHASKATWLV